MHLRPGLKEFYKQNVPRNMSSEFKVKTKQENMTPYVRVSKNNGR